MATDTDNIVEPQELRRAYDKLMEDFTKLQGDHRNLVATTTFREAKLNPKHAELFLRVNGDGPITTEAAAKFADDYGLVPLESATPTPEGGGTPEPANQRLADMSGASTQGAGIPSASPAGPKMSQAEFQKMLSNDTNAAVKAYAEGRVEHAEGNVTARDAVQKGLIAG